jgi:hypothetical protein
VHFHLVPQLPQWRGVSPANLSCEPSTFTLNAQGRSRAHRFQGQGRTITPRRAPPCGLSRAEGGRGTPDHHTHERGGATPATPGGRSSEQAQYTSVDAQGAVRRSLSVQQKEAKVRRGRGRCAARGGDRGPRQWGYAPLYGRVAHIP